jgi:hypothetical protein
MTNSTTENPANRRNRPKSEENTTEVKADGSLGGLTDNADKKNASGLVLQSAPLATQVTSGITMRLPNDRPIVASHMVVHGTFGNRPIAVSENKFLATLADGRPVGTTAIDFHAHGQLPGNRPIPRPVAPNEAVGVAAEMGYLD